MPKTHDPVDPALIRSSLEERIPGLSVHWREETGSTNSDILKMADEGAVGWMVLGADRQTAGRGRHRRNWASPPGGLYFSVLLPILTAPNPVTLVPLAVGLALQRAIIRLADQLGGSIDPRLKWPNDIMTPSGKLAGILCETVANEQGWRFVAGIGVNFMPLAPEARKAIPDPVTSLLEEADLPWTRSALLTTFLELLTERVAQWHDDPQAVRNDYVRQSRMFGTHIRIKDPLHTIEGIAEGISELGALRLRTGSGMVEITAAECIEVING